MVRILGSKGSRRRHRNQLAAILSLVAVLGIFVAQPAFAVHDEDFQLDGDMFASSTTNYGNPPHIQHFDWDSFFNSSGGQIYPNLPDPAVPGFTASGFQQDFVATGSVFDTNDTTTYTQGSKDTLNISTNWVCADANNVTNKGDIMNAYSVAYTDPNTGDQKLYFALERSSNAGDANVAFWFLQDANANCSTSTGTKPWTGDHVDGDILIVSAFTKGGTVSGINAYRWNGGAGGSLGTSPVAGGGDCRDANQQLGDSICATANTGTLNNVPWLTNNNGKQTGLDHTLLASEFFEGGINLTDTSLAGKCFNTFVGDTRSSQQLNATLYDYARGSLGECKSTTTTTPTPAAGTSTEIPANAQVTTSDSAEVKVTGVSKFSGSVKFSLCGPLAPDSTANCQTGGVTIATKTFTDVTSPHTETSGNVTLTKVGKYCWRAEYSGDTPRGVPPSSDPKDATSQTECFKITPKTPTLSTQAVASPVDFGQPVADKATLTGTANEPGTGGLGDGSINPTTLGGKAQGKITFTLFKSDCTTLATGTGTNPQTVDINGDGTYGPVSFTPDAPGTYYWDASYPGDPPNTNAATNQTPCPTDSEKVVVRQIPTEIKTKQSWIPNDTATISATTGNLAGGGKVEFSLYDNATCTGTAKYTETITLVGGGPTEEVSTSNTGTGPSGFKITTDYTDATGSVKAFSWKVVYTPAAGDTAHTGKQSACDAEHFSITYMNDPGPGTNLP
jgi:hypothetical protein